MDTDPLSSHSEGIMERESFKSTGNNPFNSQKRPVSPLSVRGKSIKTAYQPEQNNSHLSVNRNDPFKNDLTQENSSANLYATGNKVSPSPMSPTAPIDLNTIQMSELKESNGDPLNKPRTESVKEVDKMFQ